MLNEHEQHASLECTRARVNKLLEFQLILLLFLLRQFTTKAGSNCKNCADGDVEKRTKFCGRRENRPSCQTSIYTNFISILKMLRTAIGATTTRVSE